MRMSDSLLPEFEQEGANTRKTLERLSSDKLEWRPHPKSWTMIALATHLANLPTWTSITLKQDAFDLAPLDGPPPRTAVAHSRQEVLELCDKKFTEACAVIAATKDEEFFKTWSLLMGGKTIFTMPRIAVLRSFVFNHSIHHRGQLTIYLRLNDVSVPALYGPSAGEA